MSGTTTKLTAAVEEYFADLRRVRVSRGATQERSLYGPLGNLLAAVGATLRPKVFCVQELADQGAGHPDFGLYAARQLQRGAPRDGQTPERGVVEVKSPADDAWVTAGRQAGRYWGRYRLVLVTNARDFVLVGADASGKPATLETLRRAGSEDEFLSRLEKPHAFARDSGARLGEYLARGLSHRAALAEPRDLAWLLASYARDGLSRVEAAGGAPQLAAVRAALEDALGTRFEGDRGQRFFRLDAGADPVLRHLLCMGALGTYGSGDTGAGAAVHQRSRGCALSLARSRLATEGARASGAVSTDRRSGSPATARSDLV